MATISTRAARGKGRGVERRALATVLALFALPALFVYLLGDFALPFVVGAMTGYLLDPAADRLQNAGLSRSAAAAILLFLFLLTAAAFVLLLIPLLVQEAGALLTALPQLLDAFNSYLSGLPWPQDAHRWLERLEDSRQLHDKSLETLMTATTSVLSSLFEGGLTLFYFFALTLITPVVAFYMLRDWDSITRHIDSWLPRNEAPLVRREFEKFNAALSGYVRGLSTVVVIMASFYAIALSVIGVPYALALGGSAGILIIVPVLGSLTAFAGSMAVALGEGLSTTQLLAVALVFAGGQATEAYYLTPRLVGARIGVHPLWFLAAVFAGGAALGLTGIMLAGPLAAVAQLLGRLTLAAWRASRFYESQSATP